MYNKIIHVTGNSFGEAWYKEVVDFGEVIGEYMGRGGEKSSTTRGIIHYGKNGRAHIVPALPIPEVQAVANKYGGWPDKITILWSCQRALTTYVGPNLRRVYVGWDSGRIDMYFIFDGEISDEDLDDASCVSCEVSADFVDDCGCTSSCVRIDYPKLIPAFGQVCVYARKEVDSEFEGSREPFLSYLGKDYQKIEKDWVARRLTVLLSCQRALLGAVPPHLRRVLVRWTEDKIVLQFIFDGRISQSDEDDAGLVARRIEGDFEGTSKVEAHCVQFDFPNRYKGSSEEDLCVYCRKEIYPDT
jgi:hypothetical protein